MYRRKGEIVKSRDREREKKNRTENLIQFIFLRISARRIGEKDRFERKVERPCNVSFSRWISVSFDA